MNTQLLPIFTFFCVTLSAQSIKITHFDTGIFSCFDAGATDNGKPCYCETSAVVFTGTAQNGGTIYFASDKNTPNGSPLFHTQITGTPNWQLDTMGVQYVQESPLRDAKKYEDFALSADGQWVFAITGFDRVDAHSHQMDAYNTLLVWKKDTEDTQAQVISDSEADGVVSSVGLRQAIAGALAKHHKMDSVPYFKIEGLSATPNGKLLFGIREMGNSYSDFQYCIELVQVSYTIKNQIIQLKNDWRVVYSLPNTLDAQKFPSLVTPLGLSSIEYDPYAKRYYLLTSHELEEGKSGAYLWVLSEKAFKKRQSPVLVCVGDDGAPLHFRHKAEDITPLARNTVFVIHDDDRTLLFDGEQRLPHQAAYSILSLTDVP